MKRWPLAILIFFLVVAAMNAVFVYLAVTTDDGVVESYYETER